MSIYDWGVIVGGLAARRRPGVAWRIDLPLAAWDALLRIDPPNCPTNPPTSEWRVMPFYQLFGIPVAFDPNLEADAARLVQW